MTPTPGIYNNVAEYEYSAWDAVRSSNLVEAMDSWAQYRYATRFPKGDTEAFALGRAFHLCLLEPSRAATEIVTAPSVDRRTKAGKAEYEASLRDSQGKIVVSSEARADMEAWASAIRSKKEAAKWLSMPNAENEVSILWNDTKTGLACKARIDRLIRTKTGFVVLDIKTDRTSEARAFARTAIGKYHYDLKAAHYLDGLSTLYPDADLAFLWIVVKKTPHHCVSVFEASDPDCEPDALTNGANKRTRLMRGLAECVRTGVWPEYHTDVVPLRVPSFGIVDEEDENV